MILDNTLCFTQSADKFVNCMKDSSLIYIFSWSLLTNQNARLLAVNWLLGNWYVPNLANKERVVFDAPNYANPFTYSNHFVHHFLDVLVDDGEFVRHERGRLAPSNSYRSDAIEHRGMGAGACCSNHFWFIEFHWSDPSTSQCHQEAKAIQRAEQRPPSLVILGPMATEDHLGGRTCVNLS